VEADNEVGLKSIETLGDEDEEMENLLNDTSRKEEDMEIDIDKYTTEEAYRAAKEDEEVVEDESNNAQIQVDVDKVYNDE